MPHICCSLVILFFLKMSARFNKVRRNNRIQHAVTCLIQMRQKQIWPQCVRCIWASLFSLTVNICTNRAPERDRKSNLSGNHYIMYSTKRKSQSQLQCGAFKIEINNDTKISDLVLRLQKEGIKMSLYFLFWYQR